MAEIMTLREAIRVRHAVRAYTDEPIGSADAADLRATIGRCNREGGLSMRLMLDDTSAFDNFLTHYGLFTGVRNYVAIVSDGSAGWQERCGYHGARVMLRATQLGLDTCWVRMFAGRKAAAHVETGPEERARFVIALGHGATHGRPHRSKPYERVAALADPSMDTPGWFRDGVEAALLAPTSLNQQRFSFRLEADGRAVTARPGLGPCSRTDLGIAKLHFEIGAGGDAPFVRAAAPPGP